MDELLPKIMLEAIQMVVVMGGILIMEIIINHWMLIPMLVMLTLYGLLTKYYLRTAQNVKRLEGVSKYWKKYILYLRGKKQTRNVSWVV